jgi:starch phosphorylase
LLLDPERLQRILLNKDRPVQLILAGKAHPGDGTGQAMIKDWIQFINTPELKKKVIFLSDYDMLLTEHLVQGVDLWINTPRRPWEACGTSGMKVLVNGGINLSELDGWWDEAYSAELGWAIGDRKDHGGDLAWDKEEANQFYDLLELEIIPEFYTRNKDGIPEAWVNRMRESMARLTPRFSANRSLREYTERYYLPAAKNYLHRAANNGELGRKIEEWKLCFSKKWEQLSLEKISIETKDDHHHFLFRLYLNGLCPEELHVELYANGINGGEPTKQKMEIWNTEPAGSKVATYRATVPADRPAEHYTPRIIPCNELISIPLEFTSIFWSQ